MSVWCMCAGVRLCDLLLVLPPLLPRLLRPVLVPILQRLHKGLGLPLLTMWKLVWERASMNILRLHSGKAAVCCAVLQYSAKRYFTMRTAADALCEIVLRSVPDYGCCRGSTPNK